MMSPREDDDEVAADSSSRLHESSGSTAQSPLCDIGGSREPGSEMNYGRKNGHWRF